MKAIVIFFMMLVAILTLSCGHDTSQEPQSAPIISNIYPDIIYSGGKVRITGQNFGQIDDLGKVYFNNIDFIRAIDCISWNDSKIEFIMPNGISSGDVYIEVFNQFSNKIPINISAYPPFEMIEINAGTFSMGFVPGPSDEEPIHNVTISKSFLISKFEVTGELFFAVMGYDTSQFKGIDIPVNGVSWIESIKFCNALSVIDGYTPAFTIDASNNVTWNRSANGYRLPTEAEWEYSCRAGSSSAFAGSGDLEEMGWFALNSGSKPQPIGRKNSNDWNINDMHGNLWEWCWDFYDAAYYKTNPNLDPTGPIAGSRHVLRGGSFLDGITFCRSTNRQLPENTNIFAGIRLVRNK